MKKILVAIVTMFVIILAGCGFEEPKIHYNGDTRPVHIVEKIISNKLEADNPGLDIDVMIQIEEESQF
jgi:uncharacterized protein YxeA